MKRTLPSRLLETGLLILALPIAVFWAICYVVIAASLDVANRVAGVWSES